MIHVEHLTKRYGGYTAVDDVSFDVRPGSVTGFLGPNGAGKSTCMRMMCGLTPPTSGTTTVLGRPYASLPNPGRYVGVLLDASAQHAGRTGREVLTLGAIMMGLDRRRVDEMLDLVGLTDAEAGRRLRNYSLGMRQRLGIAHALLGDPQVLVLDEPANGLDPAGIRWMRGLLLSSHLLHEIEVIADELVVIGRGRIVASGRKGELMRAAGTVVRSTDNSRLVELLRQAGVSATVADESLLVDAEPLQIGQIAAANRVVLTELKRAGARGLEDMFLELTAADAREGVAA